MATAMVNGLAASLLFGLARRVAGAAEALAAGLVFAVVCLPVWRQASPHWLSTCLGLATAAVLLGERRSPDSPAAMAGALTGPTARAHQHHGVFLGISLVIARAALAWLAPAGEAWSCRTRRAA